uniref:DUF4536 domain-containing protein n=1 Tax=Strongyloides papillosus TaxID=174720 RepID=A0A0N5BXK8_STREA
MKPSPNLSASFQTIKSAGGWCKYKCCFTGVAALGLMALAYYYYTKSNSQSTNNKGIQKKLASAGVALGIYLVYKMSNNNCKKPSDNIKIEEPNEYCPSSAEGCFTSNQIPFSK